MSYGKTCEEPGCKNFATNSISVALRSRPGIATEISNPMHFVCDDHKSQTMQEFLPQQIWDKLVLSKKAQGLPMPIKTVSYLVVMPWKPTLKFV